MDLGRYGLMFRLSFFGRERVEDMSLVTYFKLIFKYTLLINWLTWIATSYYCYYHSLLSYLLISTAFRTLQGTYYCGLFALLFSYNLAHFRLTGFDCYYKYVFCVCKI